MAAVFALTGVTAPRDAAAQGGAQPPMPPTTSPVAPKSPPIPKTFEGLFEQRWARARDVHAYLRCLDGSLAAMRGGALGQVPSTWALVCVKEGAEWRGVLAEASKDSPDVHVRMQYAPPSVARYAPRGIANQGRIVSAPIDTARVAAVSRAMRRALSVPLPGGSQYQFVPVVLPQEGYVEILFVPAPQKLPRVVVGGDSVIQMAGDGSREFGHTRSAPPIRAKSVVTDGAVVTIDSGEERIPLLSEFLAAEQVLDVAPTVRMRTYQFESTLTRTSTTPRHADRVRK